MYFIFRHSEKSTYKDKIGKVYHFTSQSPNYEKVKVNSWVLIYKKGINSFLGYAKIGKIEKKIEKGLIHFYAFYKNFKKFKQPLFCDEDLMKKVSFKLVLDRKMPGIVPISKKVFEAILKEVK